MARYTVKENFYHPVAGSGFKGELFELNNESLEEELVKAGYLKKVAGVEPKTASKSSKRVAENNDNK